MSCAERMTRQDHILDALGTVVHAAMAGEAASPLLDRARTILAMELGLGASTPVSDIVMRLRKELVT